MEGSSRSEAHHPMPARSSGGKRWTFALISLALLVAAALVSGLGVFVAKVAQGRPQTDPRADGIVVLTGGAARISEALKLLHNGRAKRLLITGVNVATSREALRSQLDADKALFSCCVDLGREAVNTEGNAAEAAEWVREQNFASVILVTSNYHMPRSLIEFRRYLPDVTVIPYPVTTGSPATGSARDMLTDHTALRLVAIEYAKYLIALARMIAWDSWRSSAAPARS
ncbi:YdcF family protein [Rhodoligotrophos defluvii]|uniref:YdcF family protein n=1 Tax=Rhodoligotrophos defluvii TaxID=2561934 RepID=UPI00148538EB|nr:YdcF family protein [Rhodoligotrophos defluvii]